jgi:hypothetical protein
MKAKWLLIFVFSLGLLLILPGFHSYAQKPAKTLTLLYSNNIYGEIDPCPS